MTIRTEVESTIAALSKTQNFAVAYEGVPFSKPQGNWVEIVFLDAVASNPTVDAERVRKRGAFQVYCFTPDGKGMKPLETLVEQIVALFPVHRKDLFTSFSVEKAADVSGAYADGAFRCAVVRVEYRQEL